MECDLYHVRSHRLCPSGSCTDSIEVRSDCTSELTQSEMIGCLVGGKLSILRTPREGQQIDISLLQQPENQPEVKLAWHTRAVHRPRRREYSLRGHDQQHVLHGLRHGLSQCLAVAPIAFVHDLRSQQTSHHKVLDTKVTDAIAAFLSLRPAPSQPWHHDAGTAPDGFLPPTEIVPCSRAVSRHAPSADLPAMRGTVSRAADAHLEDAVPEVREVGLVPQTLQVLQEGLSEEADGQAQAARGAAQEGALAVDRHRQAAHLHAGAGS